MFVSITNNNKKGQCLQYADDGASIYRPIIEYQNSRNYLLLSVVLRCLDIEEDKGSVYCRMLRAEMEKEGRMVWEQALREVWKAA